MCPSAAVLLAVESNTVSEVEGDSVSEVEGDTVSAATRATALVRQLA